MRKTKSLDDLSRTATLTLTAKNERGALVSMKVSKVPSMSNQYAMIDYALVKSGFNQVRYGNLRNKVWHFPEWYKQRAAEQMNRSALQLALNATPEEE